MLLGFHRSITEGTSKGEALDWLLRKAGLGAHRTDEGLQFACLSEGEQPCVWGGFHTRCVIHLSYCGKTSLKPLSKLCSAELNSFIIQNDYSLLSLVGDL